MLIICDFFMRMSCSIYNFSLCRFFLASSLWGEVQSRDAFLGGSSQPLNSLWMMLQLQLFRLPNLMQCLHIFRKWLREFSPKLLAFAPLKIILLLPDISLITYSLRLSYSLSFFNENLVEKRFQISPITSSIEISMMLLSVSALSQEDGYVRWGSAWRISQLESPLAKRRKTSWLISGEYSKSMMMVIILNDVS